MNQNESLVENSLNVNLKPYQERFIFAPFKFKFLTAAWGTGKTLALILAALNESETYPNNVGVIFRKEFEDLRDSTIKDFETYTQMKVNSSREVKLGSSTIMFRHLEELNNLQNMNLGWFAIEQGEELETDDQFTKLIGRLRRENTGRRGYVIANAKGHNWIWKLKRTGIKDPTTGARLDAHYAAKTWDNSDILPKDYLNSLLTLKDKKPKIYNRFVENSDEESDLIDIIIQSSWVEAAKTANLYLRYPIYRIVSIDVARGGSDRSVFYAIENFKCLGREEHNTRNTMELVGRAQLFAKKFDIKAYAVDEIGVGGGVADRLSELGHEVVMVNAAQKEGVPPPYYNRRAQILGFGAELFESGRVQIEKDDDDLADQLSWTKWKPIKSTGVLQAESKDEIREEYGRSPDNADAFLNGLWAMSQITPVKRDAYEEKENRSRLNPMTV